MTFRRHHRLRIKLNTEDREGIVADGHDLAPVFFVVADSGDRQARGKIFGGNRQGMIAGTDKNLRQTVKQRLLCQTADLSRASVKQALRLDDRGAEGRGDDLMAEADTEDRYSAGQSLYQRHETAGRFGAA